MDLKIKKRLIDRLYTEYGFGDKKYGQIDRKDKLI